MANQYLDSIKRHYAPGRLTARKAMAWVATGGLLFSGFFNFPIQEALTSSRITAVIFTLGVVLSLPACLAFLLPWSPGAMLLARINFKTVGQWIIAGIALVMSGYVIYTNMGYWLAQPAWALGYGGWQVLIGYIIFYLLPGLLWAPVLKEEMIETIEQDRIVTEYSMYTEGRIAILRATMLEAERIAAKKWVDLLPAEKAGLAAVGVRLARGIESTIDGIAGNVERITGTYTSFPMDGEARKAVEVLDNLTGKLLPDNRAYYAQDIGEGDPYEEEDRVRARSQRRWGSQSQRLRREDAEPYEGEKRVYRRSQSGRLYEEDYERDTRRGSQSGRLYRDYREERYGRGSQYEEDYR